MTDIINSKMNSQSNAIMSENTDVPIKEYIVNIRDKYYPDIDISFMDFFMEMYKSNELISVELLSIYGVLNIKPDRTSLHSGDIQRLFKRCHLEENKDYLIRRQLAPNSKGAPKNAYYLTPKAFKICLISSSNETKYREYYLFLEECVHYYNIGQIKLRDDKLKEMQYKVNDLTEDLEVVNEELHEVEEECDTLSTKLDKLMAKMDMQNKELQEQNKKLDMQNRKLDEQSKELQEQNKKLDMQYEDSKKQMDSMQGTLDKIVKKLDKVAVPPPDDKLGNRFVLMKNDSDLFYVIRVQKRSIGKAIKTKESDGYYKVPELLDTELIPNSVYLWNCIRETLETEKKIECTSNDFVLKNISESDLIQVIKQVFDSRKELN